MKTFLIALLFLGSRVAAQQLYTNEKYGFSVEKPKDWLVKNHSAITTDLRESHGENLVTFYKNDPFTNKGVNPTIHIYVVANPYKTFDKFSKAYCKKTYNPIFLNYASAIPTVIERNGKKGIFKNASYQIINQKDDTLSVNRKGYVFYSKNFLYTLDLYVNKENSAYDQLFNELIQSIKIAND